LARAACNRGIAPPLSLANFAWEVAVKYLPLLAVACIASLAACEYREQTTVRPAPAATAVVTPVPTGAAIVTTPTASTTTVYTR